MSKYTAKEIKDWDTDVQCRDYTWIPCRSENHKFESWETRFKNAWGVLIGKYDALDWQEDRTRKK